jgi:hypothetical protein
MTTFLAIFSGFLEIAFSGYLCYENYLYQGKIGLDPVF